MILTLRQTLTGNEHRADNYVVRHADPSVGRIRLAYERASQGEVWVWSINIPYPIPAWCNGTAATLEEGQGGFQSGVVQIQRLWTDEDVRRWYAMQDARGAE